MAIGNSGVNWEGMSLHDHSRYIKIRRVLETELVENIGPYSCESYGLDVEEDFGEFWDTCLSSSSHSSDMSSNDRTILDRMLLTLTSREETVLRMRHGLNEETEKYSTREHTLKEIGEAVNMTAERIRQIENKALQKLRHPSISREIYSLYEKIIW